jgi:flagellar biogenesis protein FliO
MLLFSVHALFSQEEAVQESAPEVPEAQEAQDERVDQDVREEDFVFSGEENGTAPEDGTGSGLDTFGVWDLLRMVLVFLVVIGAIYGVISLLRRRVTADNSAEDSPIRILASRSVGAGQEIHAVMIGRQVLILGGGDGGLHLITRVEDQETIDELVLAHSAGSGSGRSSRTFGAILGQWLGNVAVPGSGGSGGASGRNGSGRSGGTADEDVRGLSFLKAQQNRLRNLR